MTNRTNNALIQTFTLNNSVNQLTSASRSGTLTVAGLAQGAPTSVTVKDNASPAQAATRYADQSFARAGISPADGANTFTAVAQDGSGRLATNTVTPWLPASASFTYDNNGNLTGDGRRTFEYDDANQLKSAQVAANWRTEFKYDGFGRRRVRKEYVWVSGNWNLASEIRYVYDHMLVLQERDGANVPQVTYTRGADLGGRLQGAGGIGGLLARTSNSSLLTSSSSNAHAYYYADGGGNITALVDGRQNVVARYRYDPFGNLLGLAGPLAEANVYRFSSKEVHAASGLYYYGYRFYDPSLQRWLNRDPIGERGGVNLYRFVSNSPLSTSDMFGLVDVCIGLEGEAALFDVGWDVQACIVIDWDDWKESGICVGGGPAFGLTLGVGLGVGGCKREAEGESVNVDLNGPLASLTLSWDGDGFNSLFVSGSAPWMGAPVGLALSHTKAETLSINDITDWLVGVLDKMPPIPIFPWPGQ